jgi:hypothetical protein
MQLALGRGNVQPDVWIPSESLWSDRFNEVAAKHKQRPISVARSLTLSPLVLIAHSDKAAGLRKRFPNRSIPSWDALRSVVMKDAAGHFGLTDPQKSGSGAITRLFMAREWCNRNGVAWTPAAMSNPKMWKWMNGFEDNVASYARLSGDMAKELAIGNSNRYWMAIAYESDALSWIARGKAVEVYYLPRTAYADHPYCNIERPGLTPEVRKARTQFEQFLRGKKMQTLLLQSGFRPTEIGMDDVVNSPFKQANVRARGVRTGGFRVDERINYRILNALNVNWGNRS